jgi:WD40 repeat protein/serine/threonine protein kinase
MGEPVRCASCGQPLDPPGPGGLCPVCLLKMGLQAGAGPETGGGDTAGTGTPGADAAAVPGVIGPYHLLQLLGEGGMGLVYLAEQREPLVRRVALKLIKPGMDTREVLARFEAERQALALMDHPNIDHVLDAGLGPGDRPYFVMEYVAGIPITEYCDRHRLPNAERLQLFLQVCAALQHAHQKGIIHRDMKPSNILVTMQDGKPVPKVIDFGIAKATRQGSVERAAFTQLGMLMGTPEYISPEQAEASGLEVDTTTDIYSLGVVLYELLTGVLPFDGETLRRAGYAEMHRIIREQDPPKPSLRVTALGAMAADIARQHQTTAPALGKQLRGDLDAIAMKAMDKDRTRRYASASEFAADIARYLNGEAVVASPPSVMYRSRKFVRRHRLGVAAGALVAAALIVGLVTSTLFYVQADRERAARERERIVAEQRGCQAGLLAADASLRADEAATARAALDGCAERHRGWEWRLLDRLTSAGAMTFELEGPARAAAFETDGVVRSLVLAPGNGGKRLRVVRANLARPDTGPATVAEESVIAVAPDGRRQVVTNALSTARGAYVDRRTGRAMLFARQTNNPDPKVELREAATGRTIARLAVNGIGLWTGPPRKEVAVAGARMIGGLVGVVDLATGEAIAWTPDATPYLVQAVFSPDGARVAAWSWGGIIGVWESETGRQVASVEEPAGGVTGVAFVTGANRVISASFQGRVRVWDLPSGRQVKELPLPGASAVAASPDGRWVAAGSSDGAIKVWDTSRFAPAWSVQPGLSYIGALVFAPDSRTLASGSESGICLWETSTGLETARLRAHRGPLRAVAFSGDGLRVASAGDDQTLRVSDLADAGTRVIGRHTEAATGIAYAGDGDTVVSAGGDRALRVWQVSTGRTLRTLQAPTPATPTRFSLANGAMLAVSSTGRLAAAGFQNDTSVYVWDLTTGERIRTLADHAAAVTALTFSGDGGRVIVADEQFRVRSWDVRTGQVVGEGGPHARLCQMVSLGDGGKVLSASWEGSLRIWDAGTFAVERTILHANAPACVTVAPDGSQFALGTDDGAVAVWRLPAGTPAGTLRSAGTPPTSCAYSPDGSRIAVAFEDGRLDLWDATTLERTISLTAGAAPAGPASRSADWRVQAGMRVGPGANAIAFAPDGATLASAWSDGTIRLWNASAKRHEQRARDLVDAFLFTGPLADDVVTALERETGVDPAIRAEAVRQARSHRDDPAALNSAAWRIVRVPNESERQYARALRLAQKAVLTGYTADRLNTLGVAQYRAGAYRDAVATLEKSSGMRRAPSPADLAFLAMARFRLGQAQAARAALEKLEAEMKNSNNADEAELQSFLREAQELIEGTGGGSGKQ